MTTTDLAFYAEPERVQSLNFLLHLAPYGDGMLLLTGENGSGKSSVVNQFIEKAGDNWRICLLQAEQLEALPVFLRELQQSFGFSLHGANDQSAKLDALLAHFDVMHQRGQKAILVLDDAHLLLDEVAEFIVELLARLVGEHAGRMSLILVGENAIKAKTFYQPLVSFGVHAYDLPALSQDEAIRFIQHVLTQQGMSSEALSSAQQKHVIKQANGNMGVLRQLVLGKVVSTEEFTEVMEHNNVEVKETMTEQKTSTPKKPIKFSRIVFAMLTVLLGLALYFEDAINQFFEPSQQQQVVEQVVDAQEEMPELVVMPPEDAEPTTMADELFAPAAEPVNEGIVHEEDVPPMVDHEAVDEIIEEPAALEEVVEEKSEEAVAEMEAVVAEMKEESPAEEKPAELVATEVEAVAEEVVMEVVEPEPVTEEPVVKEVAKEVASPAPDMTADESGMIRRESWILAQNPEHFTLQIMSFTQELGIAKSLAKIEEKGEFFYFKYIKDGKAWYRLGHGVYPDRAAATAAVKSLPAELGKVEPWIRRMGDLQKEVSQ